MAKPTDGDWQQLTRELSARVAAHTPGWTDPVGADPGITLVELLGFLGESILGRADLSADTRARFRDILDHLQRDGESGCKDGTLTRNRYFLGKLMSVDDFQQEQSYLVAKHRRHNLRLHGIGIVRGLGVTVEPRQPGEESAVVVSPGVAISPEGEELLVCEPVTVVPCKGSPVCYVTLSFVERPSDPTVDGEATRIEETAGIAVSEDLPPGHLAIARLLRASGTWQTDPSLRPARAR